MPYLVGFLKLQPKSKFPFLFHIFLSNQTQAQVEEEKKKFHRNTNQIPQNVHNQKKKKTEILENEEQAKRDPRRCWDSSPESEGKSRRRASSATKWLEARSSLRAWAQS